MVTEFPLVGGDTTQQDVQLVFSTLGQAGLCRATSAGNQDGRLSVGLKSDATLVQRPGGLLALGGTEALVDGRST